MRGGARVAKRGRRVDSSPMEQETLDLGVADGKRRKRRRRGSVEVLPSGAVRVRVRGIRLPDGRVVELKKTIVEGPSVAWRLEEARRKVRPALEKQALDLEMGLAFFDAGTTLADLVSMLRAGHHIRWSKKDDAIWKVLRPLWLVPLASIDDARIAGLVRRMAADGRSASYQRTVYTLLRRALGLAVGRGLLARVPHVRRGTLPSETATRRKNAALEPAAKVAVFEAARVMDAKSGGDLALRLAFQLDTGLRPLECAWAEISALKEEDGGWWIYPVRAKGSGLREGQGIDRLRVPDVLARSLLRRVDAMPVRARALGLLFPEGPLARAVWRPRWIERRGVRSAPRWVTQTEIAALRSSSGVDFFPYVLRHTRMHELARAGVSPWQLQQFGAWQSPRMVSVYAGRVKDVHPATLEPSAPLPGVSPVRSLPGQSVGASSPPVSGGQAADHGSSVGASVGSGGRGSAVGPVSSESLELDREWAAAAPEDRAALLEQAGAILDAAAEWGSQKAAAAAWVRSRGLEAARAVLLDLRVIDRAGGLAERAGELRGLIHALAERCHTREARPGVKKAHAVGENVSNPGPMGAAAGYRFT